MSVLFTTTILFRRLRALELRVEKVNRRATKLDVPPFALVVGQPRIETYWDDVAARQRGRELVDVQIEGAPIKLAGWTLLARVDFVADEKGEALPVVSRAPWCDEDLGAHMAGLSTRCDHCRVSRPRRVVYLVRHDDGATKVVGSNCLRDFTGHPSAAALVDLATAVRELAGESWDEGEGMGGGGEGVHEFVPFLTWVSATIRELGWTSRSEAWERPGAVSTADYVMSFLGDGGSAKAKKLGVAPTRSDRAAALLAARWARRLEASGDYESNINALGRAGYVIARLSGVAASIMPVYLRRREDDRMRALVNPQATVGTPKKREAFEVVVTGLSYHDSMYGTKARVSMVEVTSGATMIWWCSGVLPKEIDRGRRVKIEATVKDHGEYRGVKQTTVQRVSVGWPPPKAPRKRRSKKELGGAA